jgi:hypothetical protein
LCANQQACAQTCQGPALQTQTVGAHPYLWGILHTLCRQAARAYNHHLHSWYGVDLFYDACHGKSDSTCTRYRGTCINEKCLWRCGAALVEVPMLLVCDCCSASTQWQSSGHSRLHTTEQAAHIKIVAAAAFAGY